MSKASGMYSLAEFGESLGVRVTAENNGTHAVRDHHDEVIYFGKAYDVRLWLRGFEKAGGAVKEPMLDPRVTDHQILTAARGIVEEAGHDAEPLIAIIKAMFTDEGAHR